jgi:DNA polymerase-3 subunit epsilon
LDFVEGAELIIHNAPFDVGFLNHELSKLEADLPKINAICEVLDTLKMARDRHPGQKNNLDALCKRYSVDNTNRTLHGALLDAEILADVYLAMTGGQVSLSLAAEQVEQGTAETNAINLNATGARGKLKVIRANAEELEAHQAMLKSVQQKSGGKCVWLADTDNAETMQ